MSSRWLGVPGSSSPSIAFDFDKVAGLANSDDQDTDMSSTRSSSLSDVPEDSPVPPSSSRSPYSHPAHPATSSASTFATPPNRNGSAAPATLPSASQSHVAGPSTHRIPGASRKSSSRSLHRPVTEPNPSSSLAPGASAGSSNVSQSLRRNVSNGSNSSLSAVTTHGTRSSRVQQPPSSAIPSPSQESLTRRTNPRLPHDKDAVPAPPTAMYWSKAPVYGTMLNRPVRSHSVTLVDTSAWVLGGCDDHDSSTDIFCFDIGENFHPPLLTCCGTDTAPLIVRPNRNNAVDASWDTRRPAASLQGAYIHSV